MYHADIFCCLLYPLGFKIICHSRESTFRFFIRIVIFYLQLKEMTKVSTQVKFEVPLINLLLFIQHLVLYTVKVAFHGTVCRKVSFLTGKFLYKLHACFLHYWVYILATKFNIDGAMYVQMCMRIVFARAIMQHNVILAVQCYATQRKFMNIKQVAGTSITIFGSIIQLWEQ